MFFFGCRSESKDYFYRSEWETYTSEGFLHMYTAFSRDQPNKRYVQHCMLEHSQQLVRLLEHQEAVFYVSGYEHARQRCIANLALDSDEYEQRAFPHVPDPRGKCPRMFARLSCSASRSNGSNVANRTEHPTTPRHSCASSKRARDTSLRHGSNAPHLNPVKNQYPNAQ